MTEAEARALGVAVIDRAMADLARIRSELLAEGIDPVTAKLAELRERCRELGIVPEGGTVGTYAAARLLGLAAHTLEKRRSEGNPPDAQKMPGNRVRYRLDVLAQYLADIG